MESRSALTLGFWGFGGTTAAVVFVDPELGVENADSANDNGCGLFFFSFGM